MVGIINIPCLPLIILPLASCLTIVISFTSFNQNNISLLINVIFYSHDTSKIPEFTVGHIEYDCHHHMNYNHYTVIDFLEYVEYYVNRIRRINGKRI
jgi:hypothetical protein